MKIFDRLFEPEHVETVSGLSNELKSIYITQQFEDHNQAILVVSNSLYEANQIYQRMNTYTDDVLLFPMDEFLTSQALAMSPEFEITRLETIREIIKNPKKIVVTNLMGYLMYLPHKDSFIQANLVLQIDQDYTREDFLKKLYYLGYNKEVLVNRTGEFAERGFVIDLFPLGSPAPIRIEFWGDTITSIRYFDVDTQLTQSEVKEISILPCTELLVDSNEHKKLKHQDLSNYMKPSHIFEFLENPLVFFDTKDSIETGNRFLVEEIFNYNEGLESSDKKKYMHDLSDLPMPNVLFAEFQTDRSKHYITHVVPNFVGTTTEKWKRLEDYIKDKKTVIICVSNRYKVNQMLDEFQTDKILFTDGENIVPGNINIIIGKVGEGFIFEQYVVITEREIFNKKDHTYLYKTNFKIGNKIRDINKLNIGDYVVHYSHGIGRYLGIKTLEKNGLKKDYLQIEYYGDDKIYVPVEKMELINKYAASGGQIPKLNRMGTGEWERTKSRVQSKIKSIAFDLLKLYAQRESAPGFPFDKDTEEQMEFEKQFSYQETVDQLRVIEEVKKDMEKSRPMDRLVCGDVGFGKTEIAFRAIFKAIISGKQVALLCPTTILANQHFTNALERFSAFPVTIAVLNRFVSSKETKDVLQKVKNGKIDLLIGTHRILSDDVEFKDLGLLVVDEEQRFGVTHKEKIKHFKNNIDVLTLTATPIPRTLQMSMSGIRNLSLLETPPVNRYPIQTYVLPENPAIVKDAVYKELSRGGQTFILYNHVDTIESKMNEIQKLVPEARMIYAHGQMTKTQLENVMMKFIEHEYDVLICTTIIETGIDIPNANMLLILDADHFGLSQLYQIRGRVGRTNKIAYCYLMYDNRKILSEIATKRLKAIQDFTQLGSGFAIAMRDLSIRGAGDIIGSEQAGFIDSIGIELFLSMLNEEVDLLKGISKIDYRKELASEGSSLIDVATAIEDSYVSDVELKIEIHKKINQIDSKRTLHEIQTELSDRFGKLSEDILIYMHQEWFEKMAKSLSINQIKQTKNFIEIKISREITSQIDGVKLFKLANDITRMFRLSMKNEQLIITLDIVKLDRHFIYYLVDLLEKFPNCQKNNT